MKTYDRYPQFRSEEAERDLMKTLNSVMRNGVRVHDTRARARAMESDSEEAAAIWCFYNDVNILQVVPGDPLVAVVEYAVIDPETSKKLWGKAAIKVCDGAIMRSVASEISIIRECVNAA